MVATKGAGVQVYLRVRPQLARELLFDHAVETLPENTVKVFRSDAEITSSYHHVFPESSTQEDVYSGIRESVMAGMAGFNSTVFAYGQTGTGKTYTMMGDHDVNVLDEQSDSRAGIGIIPRAVKELFQAAKTRQDQEGVTVQIVCSYMEIYNDRLFDLLQPYKKGTNRDPRDMNQRKTQLEVREDKAGATYVPNLLCVKVKSYRSVYELIAQGNRSRAVRHTEMNQHSSRSHAILQLVIEQWPANGRAGTVVRSKLNFVDLAGSERWNTGVEMGAERIHEMTAINSSLSSLASVVAALTERGGGGKYVPYRDSKLTHLLQDSLGGNCRTTIIATVSPSADAFDETASTMRFADRARAIANNPVVNTSRDMGSVLALKEKEIARLRGMLAAYAATGGADDYMRAAVDGQGTNPSMLAEELETTKRALDMERALRSELELQLQRTSTAFSTISTNNTASGFGRSEGVGPLDLRLDSRSTSAAFERDGLMSSAPSISIAAGGAAASATPLLSPARALFNTSGDGNDRVGPNGPGPGPSMLSRLGNSIAKGMFGISVPATSAEAPVAPADQSGSGTQTALPLAVTSMSLSTTSPATTSVPWLSPLHTHGWESQGPSSPASTTSPSRHPTHIQVASTSHRSNSSYSNSSKPGSTGRAGPLFQGRHQVHSPAAYSPTSSSSTASSPKKRNPAMTAGPGGATNAYAMNDAVSYEDAVRTMREQASTLLNAERARSGMYAPPLRTFASVANTGEQITSSTQSPTSLAAALAQRSSSADRAAGSGGDSHPASPAPRRIQSSKALKSTISIYGAVAAPPSPPRGRRSGRSTPPVIVRGMLDNPYLSSDILSTYHLPSSGGSAVKSAMSAPHMQARSMMQGGGATGARSPGGRGVFGKSTASAGNDTYAQLLAAAAASIQDSQEVGSTSRQPDNLPIPASAQSYGHAIKVTAGTSAQGVHGSIARGSVYDEGCADDSSCDSPGTPAPAPAAPPLPSGGGGGWGRSALLNRFAETTPQQTITQPYIFQSVAVAESRSSDVGNGLDLTLRPEPSSNADYASEPSSPVAAPGLAKGWGRSSFSTAHASTSLHPTTQLAMQNNTGRSALLDKTGSARLARLDSAESSGGGGGSSNSRGRSASAPRSLSGRGSRTGLGRAKSKQSSASKATGQLDAGSWIYILGTHASSSKARKIAQSASIQLSSLL